MTARDGIARAIAIFDGSPARLADAIGYTDAAVRLAARDGKVSPRMAIQIERETGGEVTAAELLGELIGSGVARGDKRAPRRVA